MAYTTTCRFSPTESGADIPVCQSPKARFQLLACILITVGLVGCDASSQQEAEQTDEVEVVEESAATQPEPIEDQAVQSDDDPAEVEAALKMKVDTAKANRKGFTDRLVFPGYAKSKNIDWRHAAEQTFDMVYVPGDPSKNIKPFYLSKTEVRLEMFEPWALGYGMDWPGDEIVKRLGFYPSEYLGIFWENLLLWHKRVPALAMSRTVAENYCDALDELTGRDYRLPTEAEWEHALKLGGGVPNDRAKLLRVAHLETPESLPNEPPFTMLPLRVGTKVADRLGLHDMLGNAAEWVTDTGEQHVVRGGHFELPPEKLGLKWRAVEEIEVWNATYPQLPVAKSFYRDFPYTGIRLACDADQAPITPEPPDSDGP